jgi:hypothetical protein
MINAVAKDNMVKQQLHCADVFDKKILVTIHHIAENPL